MYRTGDGVVTTTVLGTLGDIPSGSFGVITDAHFLGEYTVEIIPGGRVLRGVRSSDLAPASDLPWWAHPTSQPQLSRGVVAEGGTALGSPTPRAAGWVLRLALAGAFLLLALYGLSAWT